MIANSKFKIISSGELYINDEDPVNDIVALTEAAIVYSNSVYNKIRDYQFSRIFKNIFKNILLMLLIAVLFIPSVVFYLITAPILRMLFTRRTKTIIKVHEILKQRIKNKSISQEDLKRHHKALKSYLDKHDIKDNKLEGEKVFRPAYEAYMSAIKEIEVTQRVAAYPEYNEVVLSYDELYELNHLTDLSF